MFGFTKQELSIIIFLVLSLLVGTSVKMYRQNSDSKAIAQPAIVEEFSNKVREIDSLKVAEKKVQPSQKVEKKEVFIQPNKSGDTKIKIDINHASAAELQKIPKIGPVLAGKIIEYRSENGNFTSLDDLINVKGIGKKTLNKIRDYLILNSAKK